MLPQNPHLKEPARTLRKNMTDAERKLWSVIRRKQIGGMLFYRQKVIGNYVVDFYCHSANLVSEVDGGQHYSEEGKASDQNRDAYLEELGLRVLRFSNSEVLKETEAVVQRIWEYSHPPAPTCVGTFPLRQRPVPAIF